jgi:predicted alpha/beta hydrolase family esterase
MKRIFIIHGWNAKPEQGWRPWLKSRLEEKGYTVEIPAMPSPLTPSQDKWIKKLQETVGVPDKNCYFVGHSLGCITILKYLETINTKVGGAVLVAGFLDGMGYPMIGSFFKVPVNTGKIKKNCSNFSVLHSEDDKLVNIKYAQDLAEKLGAVLTVEKKSGHYISREAPAVLDAVLKII